MGVFENFHISIFASDMLEKMSTEILRLGFVLLFLSKRNEETEKEKLGGELEGLETNSGFVKPKTKTHGFCKPPISL